MLPLTPSHAGFDWVVARAMADRCAAAYAIVGAGVDGRVVANRFTDTLALVINEGSYISVTFRGSCALKDWIQDFKVKQEHPRTELLQDDQDQFAEIHTGFMQDVESITEELIHAIRDMASASFAQLPPIFVGGHSKGAAEATLFALELERQKFTVAGVYLFGCPRVGNRAFANIFNHILFEETFRIVDQNDIVPRLPGVLMGYRHCGQEIFLPVGGGWCENPALWELVLSDALGLWGAYRREKFYALDVLVADHNIAAYQKRIQFL